MHNFIAKDTIRNCITKDIVMNDNDNTIALMQQVLNQDDTGRNGKTKHVDNIFPTEACADNGDYDSSDDEAVIRRMHKNNNRANTNTASFI